MALLVGWLFLHTRPCHDQSDGGEEGLLSHAAISLTAAPALSSDRVSISSPVDPVRSPDTGRILAWGPPGVTHCCAAPPCGPPARVVQHICLALAWETPNLSTSLVSIDPCPRAFDASSLISSTDIFRIPLADPLNWLASLQHTCSDQRSKLPVALQVRTLPPIPRRKYPLCRWDAAFFKSSYPQR